MQEVQRQRPVTGLQIIAITVTFLSDKQDPLETNETLKVYRGKNVIRTEMFIWPGKVESSTVPDPDLL